MYLLDTNTVINYLDDTLPFESVDFMNSIVDNHCNISVVTQIETLGFNFSTSEDENVMQIFNDNAKIFELAEAVVMQTILLRKQHKIKLPDAIIAATAIVNNLTLITRNTNDFKNIQNLSIVNPFDM
jgi:toxin FitB